MKSINFPTSYSDITNRLSSYNPTMYGKTRNHLQGQVSHLSPYITHGVLTLPMVEDSIRQRHGPKKMKKFVFELAWREYFYNIWESRLDDIFSDFRSIDEPTTEWISQSLLEGQTGLQAIDEQISLLMNNGYMHNHARMWVASLVCNVTNTCWKSGAKWFFYHLLDGDLASNTLSWQWVSGRFNGRRYRFNQQNINKYSASPQYGTFVDVTYPQLPDITIPEHFRTAVPVDFSSQLPSQTTIEPNDATQVLVYHPWMLNPKWREEHIGRRILLMEPRFFKQFPMSPKRIEFICELAKNINNIEIHWADFSALKKAYPDAQLHSVYHPSVEHWEVKFDPMPKMFPTVKGFYKSFFQFWNRCVKIKKEYR